MDCCLYVAVLRLKVLSVLYCITQALLASRVFSVFETAFVRFAFWFFVFVCLCCFIEECFISHRIRCCSTSLPLSFLSVHSGASVCTLTFLITGVRSFIDVWHFAVLMSCFLLMC